MCVCVTGARGRSTSGIFSPSLPVHVAVSFCQTISRRRSSSSTDLSESVGIFHSQLVNESASRWQRKIFYAFAATRLANSLTRSPFSSDSRVWLSINKTQATFPSCASGTPHLCPTHAALTPNRAQNNLSQKSRAVAPSQAPSNILPALARTGVVSFFWEENLSSGSRYSLPSLKPKSSSLVRVDKHHLARSVCDYLDPPQLYRFN